MITKSTGGASPPLQEIHPAPRVSVVIPTYNRAAMLQEAVDSALAQTFQDFEIVIVDDGSTDTTREIVEKCYGENPKVRYLPKKNGGPAAARNYGVARARGEWLAFHDSDDLWMPHKLEMQMARLQACPEASLCFSDAVFQGGTHDEKLYFETIGFKREATLAALLNTPYIPTASVVVKKDALLAAGGFDENLLVTEDWDMWIRIMATHSAVFIDKPLYIYRVHDEQITRNTVTAQFFMLKTISKHRHLFEKMGISWTPIYARFHRYFYKILAHHVLAQVVSGGAIFPKVLHQILVGKAYSGKRAELFRNRSIDALQQYFPQKLTGEKLIFKRKDFAVIASALTTSFPDFKDTYRQVSETLSRELALRGRFQEARWHFWELWVRQPWRLKVLLRWAFAFLHVRLWASSSPHTSLFGETLLDRDESPVTVSNNQAESCTPPLISIIVPTYNRAPYIGEALQSIFTQTLTDYEVIIVDDGSTDNTREALAPFMGRIRYLYQENKGEAAARNTGIRAARGQYIAFLDSDDLWEPTFLEETVGAFSTYPSAKLITTDFCVQNTDGTMVVRRYGKNSPGPFFSTQALLYEDWRTIGMPVVERAALLSVGDFDVRFRAVDMNMWLRFSLRHPMAHVPKILQIHRRHGDNIGCNDAFQRNDLLALKNFLFTEAEYLSGIDDLTFSQFWRNVRIVLNKLPISWRMQAILWSFLRRPSCITERHWCNRGYKHYTHHHQAYLHLLEGRRRDARRCLAAAMRLRPLHWKNYAYWMISFFPISVYRCLRSSKKKLRHAPPAD